MLAVDLGSMQIEAQLRLVRQADVFAGYHGAALTLALFMPEESALVEIMEYYRCGAGRNGICPDPGIAITLSRSYVYSGQWCGQGRQHAW